MPPTTTARADFSHFGAAAAFPGSSTSSWGACLVEPPTIGALRRAAHEQLVPLGTLARPRSGIPTRVVGYFCLEEVTTPNVLANMGIRSMRDRQRLTVVQDGRGAVHVLERDALKPMVRRPADLEGKIDVTEDDIGAWRMLYLSDDKADLGQKRWSNTLAYIGYGETQDFPAREGSRRAGGVPARRPQVRVRPVWFQVPRIPTGPGRVCWIKGRGETHYAPVLAEDILIPDNFQYSAPPAGLDKPRAFPAVANLSWTHLMAELYGRRGGGDGVLHTYIRELFMMPLIDPRKFSATEAEDLIALFNEVAARPVLPIGEELQRPDRQAFDAWAMQYLFGDEAEAAARAVERAIRDLVTERLQRAASGREQERRAVRRTVFDPAPIAARVLMDHGRPPSILEMIGAVDADALGSVTLDIPPHELGRAEVGSTLLDMGDVVIGRNRLMSTPSETYSEVIVAVLTTNADYSGSVVLPDDEAALGRVYGIWVGAWVKWRETVEEAIRTVLPRAQQAGRRVQVARELELRTSLPRHILHVE